MLEHLLVYEIFTYLLIFTRVGAGLMLMPGIGEIYVPPRIRLLFALAFSLALMPVLAPRMPSVPGQPFAVLVMVAGEALTGLFLGSIARMLISGAHTAGTIIAMQSGLATAMMLDISQTTQSTVITNLLSVTAVTMFFAGDLHHLLLHALAQSYDLFTPGTLPPVGDAASFASQTLARTFTVAMQLAAPHIVIGTILYLAAGVMSRLMPTMQILFILLAPQIMLGFFLLMITLSGMMMWYMGYLQETFSAFVVLK